MSGIYGMVQLGGKPITPEWFLRMGALLEHRGPDAGGGSWISENIALGSFNLAVTPESEYEQQPWHYHHWTIVADSRLDNRTDLLGTFGLPASTWGTTPDSQLILRAFARWGENCVQHLLGDFAFAIWDRKEQQLFCAKDYAGVKPFFYTRSAGYFVFSSELKPILQLPFVKRSLNESKFREFLLGINGFDKTGETLFEGINRLRAAQKIRVAGDNLISEIYWKAEARPRLKLSSDEAYEEAFRELIVQAVKDRIRSNHPVGILLSGGLDSSTIAGVATACLRDKKETLYAASAVLPVDHQGVEEDERSYIEAIRRKESNIRVDYVTARDINPFDDIEEIFKKTFIPVNNFYYLDNALLKKLKQRKVRRILSGIGGDGTASYYGKNILAHIASEIRFGKLYSILQKRWEVDGISRKQALQQKVILPVLKSQFGLGLFFDSPKVVRKQLDNSPIKEEFALQTDLRKLSTELEKTFYHPANVHQCVWNESLYWFREEDYVMEAHAQTEMAFPLVDKRIIDFLLSLPPEQFLHKGWKRGLIRYSMDGYLPEEIQWRKDKTMFSPDFCRRLVKSRPVVEQLIREVDKDPLIHYYLDLDKIRNQLSRISIPKNWKEMDNRSLSIVGVGIMAIKYLQFFQRLPIFENEETTEK